MLALVEPHYETTILRFRHLLKQHELCGQILDRVNNYLASRGIRICTGTFAAQLQESSRSRSH